MDSVPSTTRAKVWKMASYLAACADFISFRRAYPSSNGVDCCGLWGFFAFSSLSHLIRLPIAFSQACTDVGIRRAQLNLLITDQDCILWDHCVSMTGCSL